MKRITLLAAALAATASLLAAPASASTRQFGPGDLIAASTCNDTGGPIITDDAIEGYYFDEQEHDCLADAGSEATVCLDGANYTYGSDDEELGPDVFVAVYNYLGGNGAVGACAVELTRGINSAFLCKTHDSRETPSAFSLEPGPDALGADNAQTALTFFAQGWHQPNAVKGNIAGGTNVGGFHLDCGAAGPTSGYVGDGGDVYAASQTIDANPVVKLGFYPVVG